MEIINTIVGTPLGWLMWLCYKIFSDYGIAIIFFTLLTKVVMFPISLLVQKNSIKMVKMKPELDALKYQYIDDQDAFVDAQAALYKREKYSPMAGVWPLLLQLPIIFGLIDVVYKPLKHLLHMPTDVINAFTAKAGEILGMTDLGSSPQLRVVELLSNPDNVPKFLDLQDSLTGVDVQSVIDSIRGVNMHFFGINLADRKSVV